MANQLIDCTTFFVDNNILLNVGLDPDVLFKCVVCITTNSQCVKMSVKMYQTLNIILNNLNLFLPFHKLEKEFQMITIDENQRDYIVSIKCLQEEQNVHLTKDNVARMLELIHAVEEVIDTKSMFTRSIALHQACKMSMFLAKDLPLSKSTTLNEALEYLTRIDVMELKEHIPVVGACLIADLKIKARKQLAGAWLSMSETEVIRIYFLHNINLN